MNATGAGTAAAASRAGPAAARSSGSVAWRPPFQTRRPAVRFDLRTDWAVAGLMFLAVVLIGTIPLTLLTYWKINYVTSGGSFYEKIHPATYVVVAAFLLLLARRGDPIGEIDRMFSGAKLLLIYFVSVALLFIHALMLGRPATAAIDTFLLPALLCLVVWQLAAAQKRPMTWAVHAVILLNVALGYYEYLVGHRLIPMQMGDVIIKGDWRSTALLGHPLSASAVIAVYTLTMMLRPSVCPWPVVRLVVIALCLGALTVFGGRTAFSMVLVVVAALAAREVFRLLTGARISLLTVIISVCVAAAVAAGILALIELGAVDKWIHRFSSDNGSAWARLATLRLLGYFDWRELLLGPDPNQAVYLQRMAGLRFGIEDFWIANIVQYGIVHTVLLTVGLVCFFTEVLRRSHPAARVVVLFIAITAATSVGFAAKNSVLAEFMMLIVVLLPRERIAAPQALQRVNAKTRAGGGLRNGTWQCASTSITPTLGVRSPGSSG